MSSRGKKYLGSVCKRGHTPPFRYLKGNCVACSLSAAATRRTVSPEKVKALARRAQIQMHGLTMIDYYDMLADQEGLCAVCKSAGKLVVDHDHRCCPKTHGCEDCVRGLLCQRCNIALGTVKDNAETLRSMIAYLRKYQ